jgi:hypothetical protein
MVWLMGVLERIWTPNSNHRCDYVAPGLSEKEKKYFALGVDGVEGEPASQILQSIEIMRNNALK